MEVIAVSVNTTVAVQSTAAVL